MKNELIGLLLFVLGYNVMLGVHYKSQYRTPNPTTSRQEPSLMNQYPTQWGVATAVVVASSMDVPRHPTNKTGAALNVSTICNILMQSILHQCGNHDTIIVNLIDGHYARHVKSWSSMISSSKISAACPFLITMDLNATASAQAAHMPHFDVSRLALHADVQTGRKTWSRFLPAGLGAWRFMTVSAALKARKRVIMSEMDVLYDPQATFKAIQTSDADYAGMISGSKDIYNAGFFMTQGPKAEAFFWCMLNQWLDHPSDVLAKEQMFMNAHLRRRHRQCIPIQHMALDSRVYSCCRRWHKNATGIEVAHITYCRRLGGSRRRRQRNEDRCKKKVLAAFYSAPFSLEKLRYVGDTKQGLVPGC